MTASVRRVVIGAGLVAVVLIATQVDPHRVPLGTVLYGVLYGSLNGLLAIGLVLIYRISRVINFAYGAMGGLGAAVGVGLYSGDHWAWGPSILIGVLVGAVLGAAVSALIEWRFAKAPRLVVTVVTIGLAQLLGGIAVYIPRWTATPPRVALAGFQTGLSSISHYIKPVLFTGNELLILIVVPLAVAGVAWFLLRTDAGRAVRAIADNGERARLLGIPARRLMIGVWALSGVVAALAVLLAAPDQGVTITATAGPTLLLAPLAAAVVAKMERLWVAFAAAVGLGVLQYLTGLNVSKQNIATVVLLVVVVVALLFQHRSGSRAEAADESSWSAAGTIAAIPQALRDWRPLRVARGGALVAVIGLALALPALLPPSRLDQISGAIVFALVALSLVILSGWGGTISLGQFALVGVGAITAGDLLQHTNSDLFMALGAGAVAAALAAIVLGLPALRVKGLFLAVTTLAFAVAADDFFFNGANFPNQLPSAVLRPVLWKRFNLAGEGDLYLLCLGVLALTILLTYGLRRSRTGRAVLATRDNLRGAEAASVPTTKVRLMAFAISGLIAGLAGGIYIIIYSTAAGTGAGSAFPSSDSLLVFSMAVIGGLTSIGGALTGVAILEVIGIAFPNVQVLLSGIGLLIILVLFPSGLAGIGSQVRNFVLSQVAKWRGLDASVWGDAELESADDVEPVVVKTTNERPVVLRCSNVNASYGSLQVLFGVDLTVHQGEILALLGTNGAGKSSLLKSITGLLPAHQGTITLGGHDITSHSTERIAARGLTMMPGGRGTFASLTVAENLRVASWALRRDRVAAATQRRRALELFPALTTRSNVAAGNLSGGEQQMLSLAMAFLNEPQVLCIDELSLGLAPAVVTDLIEAVKAIHQRGTTIVIVEQSVNVALLIAERAVFLEKGQVRFSGPSADLLDRPDLLRAVFIGEHDQDAAAAAATKASPRDEDATPILVAQGITKRYGGITAVDHVDLTIRPHEIVGLIGHNGAGKTTLFDAISGFVRVDEGTIELDGIDVTTAPAYWRSIGGLGRSFQEARLFPTLSVAETIAVSLERHLANRDPFAAALRLPACTDSEARATIRVDEIIELLGLEAYRDRPTGALSTGTRRIVELACILAHKPSLLMLDEPTAGVAQAETEALGPLLRRVAAETDCAMVVIEHDMAMIASLCDRLVALELGAVIAEGVPSDVLSSDAVIASYLGSDPAMVMRSGPSAARTRPVEDVPRPQSDLSHSRTTESALSLGLHHPPTSEVAVAQGFIDVDVDVEPEPAAPVGGLRSFRDGLGPHGLLPLVLLAGLAAAQSFDSNAFGVLAPLIRHTFHLNNAGIDSVAGLTGALPLLGSVFIGHFGDRSDRIWLSRNSAILWGVTAILTGVAPVLGILVMARLLGGIGLLSTQTVYPSLLSDYYPLNRRAQVFTVFLLASVGLGLVATPLSGLLGDTYGWRPSFVILALPTFVFAFLLYKLRDPSGRRRMSRGRAADAAATAEAAPKEHKSIRESFRIIRQSRTLRRTWLGAFILGGAATPIGTLLSNFFHDVYHVDSAGRGGVIAAVGVGGLIGLAVSGTLAQRILADHRTARLPVITGVFAAACAVCVFLIAASPTLWFAVVATALAGIGLGGFLPVYTTIVSIVSPAELRSQAFAWSTVFFAIGAVVVSLFVGTLADKAGQRTAVAMLAVVVVLGAGVLASARRFIAADVIDESVTDAGLTSVIG